MDLFRSCFGKRRLYKGVKRLNEISFIEIFPEVEILNFDFTGIYPHGHPLIVHPTDWEFEDFEEEDED